MVRMTDNSPASDDPLTAEANLWVIRLTEEPDDRDLRKEFSAWYAHSPTHADAWSRALRVWRLTGAVEPALLSLPDKPKNTEKFVSPRPSSSLRALAGRHAVAFSLATALCGLGLFFLPDIRIALQADYQTSTGKDQTVTLADGTVVTLGAHSAIAVHYRPGTRDVTLLAGEAFFQVKHDATRPFRVTAGAIQARDIGTRFDVRLDPTEIRVGVQDGRVGVSSPTQTQEVILNAGDEINVDRSDGHVTRKTVSPDTIGSWQTGTLVVDSDTVGHVTDTLKRYYPGFIVNWSAKLRSRQVGGIYDLHNIPAALRAAVVPSGGQVREVAGHMLIATDAPTSHEQ
ncbi:FecR domain-containing protein [Acetobacter senegalensis]|nr:FecR domain-containing protein [Acetobacter senegalensis]MCG4268244.1 FecR domain-containing protein [Acetobacter senegalensis]